MNVQSHFCLLINIIIWWVFVFKRSKPKLLIQYHLIIWFVRNDYFNTILIKFGKWVWIITYNLKQTIRFYHHWHKRSTVISHSNAVTKNTSRLLISQLYGNDYSYCECWHCTSNVNRSSVWCRVIVSWFDVTRAI